MSLVAACALSPVLKAIKGNCVSAVALKGQNKHWI